MIPRWSCLALRVAAIQCFAWGAFILVFPSKSAVVYGFDRPLTDEFLWKGTGLLIFLFGVGYAIAARDPVRHWVPILTGTIAKICGAVGMVISVVMNEVPSRVLYLIPINDVIWWVPFLLILHSVWKAHRAAENTPSN